MAKQKFVDFKEIKKQISITQVLQRYNLLEDLKRKEDAYSGRCPVHEGNDETEFRVNTTKNIFHCFSCEAGGNVLDFVMQMEKVKIRNAALLLQEWFLETSEGNEVKKELSTRKPLSSKSMVKESSESAESLEGNQPVAFQLSTLDQDCEAVQALNLSSETIAEFGIGYCHRGMLKHHVAIPFHNRQGELLAYCGRSLDGENYKYPPKFKPELEVFNTNRISPGHSQNLLITWDILDCLKLWDCGFHTVICIPTPAVSRIQLEAVMNEAEPFDVVKVLDMNPERNIDELINGLSDFVTVHGIWSTEFWSPLHTCSGEELGRFLAM